MKPIELNRYIKIGKCRGDLQTCSYCEKKIKRGRIGLLITKPQHLPNSNIWIHINCIDDFLEDTANFIKKHSKDIIIEELTERK